MRRVGAVLSASDPDFKRAAPPRSPASAGGPSASTRDYFEQLGLEPSVDIDLEDLERRYLERARAVHPDRFATAEARQRVASLQSSMALNQAYRALKDRKARAEYLLNQWGERIGDNEVLDPEFLAEVLEAREELSEVKAAGDVGRLNALEQRMLGQRQAHLEAAERHLRGALALADVTDQARGAALAAAKVELIALRYLDRYLQEFEEPFEAEES